VKHSSRFDQALAAELSAALANATQERISQMDALVIQSRDMVDESRDLLSRVERLLSGQVSKPASRTNPEAQKMALAKAAECERQAREATNDEVRLTMWETQQFWTSLAHSCRDDVNETL
jgi:hypothetical protein